jgi:hypothetical protein
VPYGTDVVHIIQRYGTLIIQCLGDSLRRVYVDISTLGLERAKVCYFNISNS